MFAFNQGEVCTCPSRALVHESIYDKFMERVLKRMKEIKQGNPLDTETQVGAQASSDQVEKILRSEEHTSELQSLMRISYAVFCLKKKKNINNNNNRAKQ